MKSGNSNISVKPQNSAHKHPLGRRFRAWWHGYDLKPESGETTVTAVERPPTPADPEPLPDNPPESGPLASEINPQEAPEGGPQETTPVGISQEPPPNNNAGQNVDSDIRDSQIWPGPRVEIAERVWGEGFVMPAGLDHIMSLTRPLGLNSSGGVAELGPSTGGYGRLITENFDTSVTSRIPDPALRDRADFHIRTHGLETRVSSLELNVEAFEAPPEHFDVVLVHECLYLIENKELFLRSLIKSLRADGEFLIYDYFCADDDGRLPLVEWITADPADVHPMDYDSSLELIGRLGVDITASEDESTEYAALVLKVWGDFVDQSDQSAVPQHLAMALVKEVEYWTRFVAAIDCGALKVMKIAGKRKAELSW